MNKKIKIIEIFDKLSKGEEVPEEILYKNRIFIFQDGLYAVDKDCLDRFLDYINYDFSNLNDEVEILEDNTEEIEEYKGETFEQLGYEVGKMSMAIAKGFEKAINALRKEKE